MLVLSLALHLSVAFGVVSSFFYSRSSLKPLSSEAKTTLTLLPPLVSTSLPQATTSGRPVHSTAAANPTQTPTPSTTSTPTDSVATEKAPSASAFAVEANPNANIPPPKPDSLLSPVPPPILNNKNGVVFLLDVSGSMYEPYAGSTRLMFARQAMSQHIRALKDGTPFAIALYAQIGRGSGPLVAATDATREAAVRFIMQDFDCGGGTNLPAGLATAEELHPGQIVLVSDGDLNISPRDLLRDADHILSMHDHGPALTIIGVAPRPNTNAESILQSLADQQGGNYVAAQSDNPAELLTSNKTEVSLP